MANTPNASSNANQSGNLESLLNQLTGSVAPATANAQFQYGLGQYELGQVNPQLGATTAYNNVMAGYSGQNLALSEQGLGIQQTALGQQGAQNTQQQALEEQQYRVSSGQYPEQQAEAALAYQNALRGTQGAQAISGTQNTVGGQADVSTLGQQYEWQKQDINRAQTLAGLGQQSEEAGFQYSEEQLANAKANLALNAQANGLSEQQLVTMLNYQNQQAAQGAQQDIIGLYSNLGSIASGQVSNLGGNLGAIGLANASGINTLAGVG